MTIVASACTVVALAVAGCAETSAAPEPAHEAAAQQGRRATQPRQATPPPAASPMTVRAHGLTAELPPGWQAATESLTPHLVDPREELAVGTYPLRYRPTECAHMPGSALEALGPGDAFVTLEERGLGVPEGEADLASRPALLRPRARRPFRGRRLRARCALRRSLVRLHRRGPPLPRAGRVRPAGFGAGAAPGVGDPRRPARRPGRGPGLAVERIDRSRPRLRSQGPCLVGKLEAVRAFRDGDHLDDRVDVNGP